MKPCRQLLGTCSSRILQLKKKRRGPWICICEGNKNMIWPIPIRNLRSMAYGRGNERGLSQVLTSSWHFSSTGTDRARPLLLVREVYCSKIKCMVALSENLMPWGPKIDNVDVFHWLGYQDLYYISSYMGNLQVATRSLDINYLFFSTDYSASDFFFQTVLE